MKASIYSLHAYAHYTIIVSDLGYFWWLLLYNMSGQVLDPSSVAIPQSPRDLKGQRDRIQISSLIHGYHLLMWYKGQEFVQNALERLLQLTTEKLTSLRF